MRLKQDEITLAMMLWDITAAKPLLFALVVD